MITLYGISNCDTVKKAKNWLLSNNIEFHFHDYKKQPVDQAKLTQWCQQLGYEKILNTRSRTWRNLADSEKNDLNEHKAIQIMLSHSSIIKRPILETGTAKDAEKIVGFKQNQYDCLL